MIMSSYFDGVADGIQFIIALGSVIGFLTFIVGIIGAIFGGNFHRWKFVGVLVFGLVLCVVCGGPTFGIKYFHIF